MSSFCRKSQGTSRRDGWLGPSGEDTCLKKRDPSRVEKWKLEVGVFKLSIFLMARKHPGHYPLKT